MADDLDAPISGENGPPWIFGLRPGYAYETWCAAIASILLGQYDDIKSGAKTLEAEHGLGIPASWYWYIARSDESFGQGVFSCGAHDIAWEPTECGVSPFDTGGLWHRHIKTHDDKTNGELRTLFQNNNRPLYIWAKCYREHLSTNYLTVADYVLGVPPSAGTEGIICTQPPNHPRAWTWEARVERKSLEGRMNIVKLYCTSEDEREFGNWVETNSAYDLPTRKAVLGKFLSLLMPCTDFAHLSLAVGRDLLATLTLWVKQS